MGSESDQLLGWHDLDEDGRITREEFAEGFAFWAATVKAAVDDTPKKYQKFHLEDMEGDFNIEDLPPKMQRKLIKAARQLEAKRSKGGTGGGAEVQDAAGAAAEL